MDQGQDRETSGAVGGARSRRAGGGLYCRTSLDLKANCFAGSPLQATLDFMLARTGNLIAPPWAPIATAGMALSMLMFAAGAGWPQAASPPSSRPPLSPG